MSLPHNDPRHYKAVSLIELLIGVVLISLVLLTLSSLDLFSRNQVINSDRRARLQNTTSYILEHINKNMTTAIGNEQVNLANSVVYVDNSSNWVLVRFYIDANGNGQREPPRNNPLATDDHWLAYRYTILGPVANRRQLQYCARCQTNQCNFNQCMDNVEVLGRNISNFTVTKPSSPLADNFVTIALTACWDVNAGGCGTINNPSVMMRQRIKMPSVSVN